MLLHKDHSFSLNFVAICILSLALVLLTNKAYSFEQVIKETSPVERLIVQVNHHDGIFWLAEINNTDPELPINILWDTSDYKSSSGRSSRLIHEGNLNIHPSEHQEASTIGAGKTLKTRFTSEDFLPYADKNITLRPPKLNAQGHLKLALKKNGEQV